MCKKQKEVFERQRPVSFFIYIITHKNINVNTFCVKFKSFLCVVCVKFLVFTLFLLISHNTKGVML